MRDKEGNQFEVDMRKRICSCRRWDLNEITCSHGCQAIMSIRDEPERYVADCFKRTTYMKSYSNLMSPMKVCKDWHVSNQTKLLHPKARRMPGRPKNIGEERQMRKVMVQNYQKRYCYEV